jgi:methionyl-tRNA formyltransferase
VSILPEWMAGRVVPREQDHSLATFTKKLTKEDGLIDLDDDPLINFRKIRAYDPWPGTYFFINHESRRIRIIIKEAELADGKLILKRIVPEGKKEMNYEDFIRNV